MALKRTQTLQIKDMMGISRYYTGINQPPNKFETIQNMYSPTRGELSLVGGVTDITGVGLPGSTAIKSAHFLNTSIGYQRYLVFYDHAALSTPSAPSVSVVTSTAVDNPFTGNRNVTISYVGLGGESPMSAATVAAAAAGKNIQVTVPTLPTGIVGINIFIDGFLMATVAARAGVVPSTVTLVEDFADFSAATLAAVTEFRVNTAKIDITYGTSGNLVPGQTYFYSWAPGWKTDGVNFHPLPICTTNQGLAATGSASSVPAGPVLSFTMPAGKTSVTIKSLTTPERQLRNTADFKWAAQTSGEKPNIFLFLGTTAEDMLLVGTNTNGFSTSFTWNDFITNELPYQSNFGTYRAGQVISTAVDYTDPQHLNELRCASGDTNTTSTVASRLNLRENDFDPTVSGSMAGSGLACMAIVGSSYDATTDYQIIPTRGTQLYTVNQPKSITSFYAQTVDVFIPMCASSFVVSYGQGIKSATYINKMFFVNGQDYPFYSNGYTIKPAARDNSSNGTTTGVPYLPITTQIAVFKDRLILGGGQNSVFNTQNVVYYSQPGSPTIFTAANGVAAPINFISALQADSDSIVGLGVYSESLSTQGVTGFLVIGKARTVYTWDGTTTSGAQPIQQKTGFASGKCFVSSAYGPVFVGRDNVYLMSPGGRADKIGNDVEAILKAIPDTKIQFVNVVFHDSHVKIGYQDTTNVDRELWLDFRSDDGQVIPIFTGPHVMTPYIDQDVNASFNSVRDCRFSFDSSKIYKRDNFSSYLDNGSNIPVILDTNEFWIRAKINKQETLTLTIALRDSKSTGSGLDYTSTNDDFSVNETLVLPYAGSSENYRLFQDTLTTRYRGSLLSLTITMSTNVSFKIQSMSILSEVARRRRV